MTRRTSPSVSTGNTHIGMEEMEWASKPKEKLAAHMVMGQHISSSRNKTYIPYIKQKITRVSLPGIKIF